LLDGHNKVDFDGLSGSLAIYACIEPMKTTASTRAADRRLGVSTTKSAFIKAVSIVIYLAGAFTTGTIRYPLNATVKGCDFAIYIAAFAAPPPSRSTSSLKHSTLAQSASLH
jgi:hypothetical protein